MPPSMQPEFFLLLGIDIFLAMSLLTALFDKHFPTKIPYIYQLAALAGYGNLIVSKAFLTTFEPYIRFWYSFTYLGISVANTMMLAIYLGYMKKAWAAAKFFTFTIALPIAAITGVFVSSYVSIAQHPLLITPTLPPEMLFLTIITFDTAVVGVGIYLFVKPKWWQITIPATIIITAATIYTILKPELKEAIFITSAAALGSACAAVLAASIYVLIKLWREG